MSTIGKGLSPPILHPVMGKTVNQTRQFNLCMSTGLGVGNLSGKQHGGRKEKRTNPMTVQYHA